MMPLSMIWIVAKPLIFMDRKMWMLQTTFYPSHGKSKTLADDDEHVSATQYDNEEIEENMEVVGSYETHLHFVDQIHNDTNALNVNEGGQVLQGNKEQLTFLSHVSHPEWLIEEMMNLKINTVTDTNDQSLNMPSQPTSLSNEVIHYFVDNGGVENQNVGNEAEEAEIDSAYETKVEVDHHNQQCTTPILRKLLKLSMERVTKKTITGSSKFLCLSRNYSHQEST
jgi:hypothetical protein